MVPAPRTAARRTRNGKAATGNGWAEMPGTGFVAGAVVLMLTLPARFRVQNLAPHGNAGSIRKSAGWGQGERIQMPCRQASESLAKVFEHHITNQRGNQCNHKVCPRKNVMKGKRQALPWS